MGICILIVCAFMVGVLTGYGIAYAEQRYEEEDEVARY